MKQPASKHLSLKVKLAFSVRRCGGLMAYEVRRQSALLVIRKAQPSIPAPVCLVSKNEAANNLSWRKLKYSTWTYH